MPSATVKWIDGQKGFGLIQPENGGADVFVHISAVERAGLASVHEGHKLTFDLERDSPQRQDLGGAATGWLGFVAAALARQGHDIPMTQQFDIRRDATGWTVFDRWTGETVVMEHVRQEGLAWAEASDVVRRLQSRSGDGDRRILQ